MTDESANRHGETQGCLAKPGRTRITVMRGGPSAEREVSLRSGRAVAEALRGLGHAVEELDPVNDAWRLAEGTEVVFLALHGTYGEDGTVQRKLESYGVAYTGCDAEASRLAFDKVLTKQRCLAAGIPTPQFSVLRAPTAVWPAGWRPPVVLKPVRQGSSVGLELVERPEELEAALGRSLRFDTEVLMEERVVGREATVGILEGRALPVIEVCPKHGAFDYHNKYTSHATDFFLPARFEPAVAARAQQAALGAFRAVGGRDYARVDVMVRSGGEPTVLEINTLPGMTALSLLPKAAAAVGYSFPALCQKMVDLALQHGPARAGAGRFRV
jgi:D-alanine-D-alanine ligase